MRNRTKKELLHLIPYDTDAEHFKDVRKVMKKCLYFKMMVMH